MRINNGRLVFFLLYETLYVKLARAWDDLNKKAVVKKKSVGVIRAKADTSLGEMPEVAINVYSHFSDDLLHLDSRYDFSACSSGCGGC